MSDFDGYVLLDIETTGLDPELEEILEVGILVVDNNFNTVATFSEVAYFGLTENNHGIVDVVLEMHKVNNLWVECAQSQRSLAQVQKDALAFLEAEGLTSDVPKLRQRMTGSTINFDRAFLAKHMPRLHDAFHYRNFDISTIKGLFEKYKWPAPSGPFYPPGVRHRALTDCFDSMNYLKGYVNRIDEAFMFAESHH